MSEKGGAVESPHLSQTEVAQLWAKFRAGDVIHCPRDGFGMALAVDGAAKAYRLDCTQCGLASPWFGTTPSGLVFRSTTPTMNANGSNE
jgi:hypothetical protein